MSGAKKVARAFNSWSREGLDMMGGADGAALEELLKDFLDCPGSSQPQECKGQPNYEYSLKFNAVDDDEDFEGHYEGNEEDGRTFRMSNNNE
jgi:hypothetical protein